MGGFSTLGGGGLTWDDIKSKLETETDYKIKPYDSGLDGKIDWDLINREAVWLTDLIKNGLLDLEIDTTNDQITFLSDTYSWSDMQNIAISHTIIDDPGNGSNAFDGDPSTKTSKFTSPGLKIELDKLYSQVKILLKVEWYANAGTDKAHVYVRVSPDGSNWTTVADIWGWRSTDTATQDTKWAKVNADNVKYVEITASDGCEVYELVVLRSKL